MAGFGIPEFLELSKEVLDRAIRVKFRVKGESMYPVLLDGDIIEVKQVDSTEIKPGDLIFASIPLAKPITHRVIKKRLENGRWVFITAGDANCYFYENIYAENVLGKIIAIERSGERVILDNRFRSYRELYYIRFLLLKKMIYLTIKFFKSRLLGDLLRWIQDSSIYIYLAKKILLKNGFTYCIATPHDALSLSRLFRKYRWPTPLNTLYKFYYNYLKDLEGSGYCILAKKGKKVIGTVTLKKDSSCSGIWYMDSPYVDWFYRKLGVGTQLYYQVYKKAVLEGVHKLKATRLTSKRILLMLLIAFLNIKGELNIPEEDRPIHFSLERETGGMDKGSSNSYISVTFHFKK